MTARIARVHRRKEPLGAWSTMSVCGRYPGDAPEAVRTIQVVAGEQFAWLPERVQCQVCRNGRPWFTMTAPGGTAFIQIRHPQLMWTLRRDVLGELDYPPWVELHATPEMEIIVETLVLVIYQVGQTEHEHRCWHDDVRKVCSCGSFNELSPPVLELALAVFSVIAVDAWRISLLEGRRREIEDLINTAGSATKRAAARRRYQWEVDYLTSQIVDLRAASATNLHILSLGMPPSLALRLTDASRERFGLPRRFCPDCGCRECADCDGCAGHLQGNSSYEAWSEHEETVGQLRKQAERALRSIRK